MKKEYLKKMRNTLTALTLIGSMTLTGGCTNTSNKKAQRIVTEIEFDKQIIENKKEPKANNYKYDIDEMLESIENSEYDQNIKEILKEIAKNTESNHILYDLSMSFDECIGYDAMQETILQFGSEQFNNNIYQNADFNPQARIYERDKIKIIDNLNGDIVDMPSHLYVFYKYATSDSYNFYEDLNYQNNDFGLVNAVVTNIDDKIILFINYPNSSIVLDDENVYLNSFQEYLKNNNMENEIKSIYSYSDLFENQNKTR